MSLVVYRDGVLYADTRAWGGDSSAPSPGGKDKVLKADDGALIGITTAVVGCAHDILAAYNAGKTFVDGGNFRAIVVKPGVAGYFYWNDDCHLSGPFLEPHFAVGSGAKYALGALEAGAPMDQVYRAAAKYDYFTDSVFRTFTPATRGRKKRT